MSVFVEITIPELIAQLEKLDEPTARVEYFKIRVREPNRPHGIPTIYGLESRRK